MRGGVARRPTTFSDFWMETHFQRYDFGQALVWCSFDTKSGNTWRFTERTFTTNGLSENYSPCQRTVSQFHSALCYRAPLSHLCQRYCGYGDHEEESWPILCVLYICISIAYSLPLKAYSPLYFVICSTAISIAFAWLVAVDHIEGRVDDLVHGHLSWKREGYCVPHCHPETRTLYRCCTSKVLGWLARGVLPFGLR